MTQQASSPQQQAKLAEALKVAQLAEEKASQMNELAAKIANKYQQRLYDWVKSASK